MILDQVAVLCKPVLYNRTWLSQNLELRHAQRVHGFHGADGVFSVILRMNRAVRVLRVQKADFVKR